MDQMCFSSCWDYWKTIEKEITLSKECQFCLLTNTDLELDPIQFIESDSKR